MIKRIYISLFLLLPFIAFSQSNSKAAKKIAKTIKTKDLKKRLYTIASKEMEGRDTPSPGLEKAADYIEGQFRAMGLQPGNHGSYRQNYPLYRDSVLGSSFTVNGHNIALNNDFQPQVNAGSGDKRFMEVVFAGYGITDGDLRDDYKGLDVKDKLVMIADGSPANYKPSATGFGSPAGVLGKMNNAASKGAAGLLIVYGNYPRKAFNSFSNWNPNQSRTTTPVTFTISPAVAEKIMGEDGKGFFEKLKAGTLSSKTYAADINMSFRKETKIGSAPNVIAMLEGTDLKEEYVFITGHMDHLGKRGDSVIYYGADDDGSGTTGVIEIAEAFAAAKKKGRGPRRTMVFMTVSGEEKGLWGSAYYTNNPVFPLEKTTVDLNIDMIGRSDASRKQGDSTNYVYVVGDDKISSDLKVISEAANNAHVKMELDYKFNDPKDPNRIYFRSDHYNFAQKGVPIIFYYDGMLGADYHKPTDTPDKINYELMAKRSRLIFYTAWEMANRDQMLKRDLKLEKPRGF
jgi:hypothetical protein